MNLPCMHAETVDLAALEGGEGNERWEKDPKMLGIRGTTNMTTFSHPYAKKV